MGRKKVKYPEQFAELLTLSNHPGLNPGRYSNQIVLISDTKTVAATDGAMALFRRDIYDTTKVLARVLGAAEGDKLLFNPESQTFAPDSSHSFGLSPDTLGRILPKTLDDGEFKRYRVEIPAWLSDVPHRKKSRPVLYLSGFENPTLTATRPADIVAAYALYYLAYFAGRTVDMYVRDANSAAVILPENEGLEKAPWLSLLMPRRS